MLLLITANVGPKTSNASQMDDRYNPTNLI